MRKKNRSEYVSDTSYHIVCGIMRHLREAGDESIDFFKNDAFADFRHTFEGEMKRLRAKGLGTSTRKVDIIEPEEEEILWSKGILGDDSPTAILNTVFHMNGLYFALGKSIDNCDTHLVKLKLLNRMDMYPTFSTLKMFRKIAQVALKGESTSLKSSNTMLTKKTQNDVL